MSRTEKHYHSELPTPMNFESFYQSLKITFTTFRYYDQDSCQQIIGGQ